MPSNTLYTPNNSLLRQNGRVLTIDNPMSSRDDFLIRALQQNNHKEVEAVVALINRSYRSKENWTSEYGIVFGLRTTISQLKADLERFYMYLAINRATGTVVGCVKVGLTKETTAGPLAQIAGHMGLLTVSSDYQSQGLGSRLADFAEKTCKERGMMTMVLDVLDVRTDIIEWYERRGYKRTPYSIDAAVVLTNKGEKLLKPSSFVVFAKEL